MDSVHSKISSINRAIGQLEAPYNPSPTQRHIECTAYNWICKDFPFDVPPIFLWKNFYPHFDHRFISPLLSALRMVQELEATLKKMETEYGALAKLNGQFEMGAPDLDGQAKFLGIYIYIHTPKRNYAQTILGNFGYYKS